MMSTCLVTGVARAQEIGDPADYQTEEFWTSWGVAMIYADHAYALGADGSGVKVGVVDSGVAPNSWARSRAATTMWSAVPN
jgi:subtilase-type serine protease